jgi:hypothetical protein
MVLQAHQAGRRALAFPEIAGGEDGNSDRDETEQQGEHGGEIVEPQMEGQVGQADDQHRGLCRTAE